MSPTRKQHVCRERVVAQRLPILVEILVIEPRGTGYSAYSPDVAGCAAAGDTKEETRRNFQDAFAAHFEAMREVGEPIPQPSAWVDYVEVAA
jgi:predicted RNase H-like HicB family nuclease